MLQLHAINPAIAISLMALLRHDDKAFLNAWICL
jgi:hypothetical protein